MNNLNSDSRPHRRDRVVHRQLQSGAVLLNLDDGSYFEVNPVGLTIWNALDGRTLDDVVGEVRSAFEGAPDNLDQEVLAFVASLWASGLIEVH